MTLTLPEKLFLLSRDTLSGKQKGDQMEYGIAGAALAELVLKDRLVADPLKRKRLQIKESSPVNNVFLDACLTKLVAKGTGKSAQSYVEALAKPRMIRDTLIARLLQDGLIGETPKSFLFFKWKNYPITQPHVKDVLIEELSRDIFSEGEVSVENSVLITLANTTDLLGKNIDKQALKGAKKRLKAIKEGTLLPAKAAIEAIEAVQTAIMLAAATPVITASVSS